MARNEEKAQATLNRYWTHRKQLDSGDLSLPERRPRFAHEVTDLKQADKWRKQIQRDIGERITRIQNASLPEQEIRTINDEINRLLKTRVHWEEQVRKLGGRDWEEYRNNMSQQQSLGQQVGSVQEMDGRELYAHQGYKYFGAAKDLPGVRELFESQDQNQGQVQQGQYRFKNNSQGAGGLSQQRKTRKELYSHILPDYYGWRDEEDVELLQAEAEADQKLEEEHEQLMPQAMKIFVEEHRKKIRKIDVKETGTGSSTVTNLKSTSDIISKVSESDSSDKSKKPTSLLSSLGSESAFNQTKNISLVHTPTDQEIEQMLLEKKRKLALEKISKYLSKNEGDETGTGADSDGNQNFGKNIGENEDLKIMLGKK